MSILSRVDFNITSLFSLELLLKRNKKRIKLWQIKNWWNHFSNKKVKMSQKR